MTWPRLVAQSDCIVGMEVRPCSDRDLPRLQAEWPTPGTDIHRAHHSAQGTGVATYLIAWQGTIPLGSAMIQWGGCVGANARRAHPDWIEINHVHVRPEHRDQAVGTRLIAAAEAFVASRGHRDVALGVSIENAAAARLYRRLGYEPTGVRDTSSYVWVDADGHRHDAHEEDELMVKHLGSSPGREIGWQS